MKRLLKKHASKRLPGLVLVLAVLTQSSTGQTIISISSGTDLYISPGTTFTPGGLSLIPSSGFTISGLDIERSTTVANTLPTVYVSDVYRFSNSSNPFDGIIRFAYSDAALNGLDESTLAVAVYDDSEWQKEVIASYDVTDNYVITAPVAGRILNELTLTDAFATLPLHWGTVSAMRRENQFIVEWETSQEQDVSHFTVERSSDARDWITALASVPARNMPSVQRYSVTDTVYTPHRVYYRIRQHDLNGRYSYSAVATVAARKGERQVLVYPNPVGHSFSVRSMQTAGNGIRLLQLFDARGGLVRTWTVPMPEYDISNLPAAVYYLHVQTTDNQVSNFRIIKQ
ncbi:MAG: T9SS type A sorting domain-containing protein [Chitinophagaceae bacterium]|nr:T9SS type A sorting domain-containing protein [Chitinophagaceae bacterium]MCW5926161.1 T9SS type A sorting domain-containing protein [Chitinophagaceae bacterium]